MKILELFSGTGSFSNVAKERGHEVFTVDFDKQFNPDLCINILDFDISMLPEEFQHPDVIWASPPCTQYSHAKRTGIRDIEGANKIVEKTIEIIKELHPKIWIIENPQTGLLKKQPFMFGFHFEDVSYCKYGYPYRKQTRFWNNLEGFKGKTCNKDCEFMDGKKHILSAGNARAMYCLKDIKKLAKEKYSGEAFELIERLTKHGLNKKDKYKVPKQLCLELIKQCEKQLK